MALVVVVGLGLHRGADTNWDLLNYHLYNGRALLTGAFRTDVAAASIQSYLSPTIDVPLAVSVAVFGAHRGVLLAGIAIQGLAYLALWRLVREYFAMRPGRVVPIAAFAVAVTGSAAMSMSYAHFGDWVTAACLCEALRLLLRAHRNVGDVRHRARLVGAGLWMGAAVGLKLTCAPFVIGMMVALPILRVGRRRSLEVVGATIAGWLMLAGYWMAWLWARFGNPFFPYFNGIFRSPSAPQSSFDDGRFGATGPWSFVRFPIDMLRGSNHYSELMFQDWRPAVALALGVAAAIVAWRRSGGFSASVVAVVTILGVGTVIWLVQFGIYRYFVFGELLISILVVHCLCVLLTNRAAAMSVACALVLGGSLLVQAPDWGRDGTLVIDELASHVDGPRPYVLLSVTRPISYLSVSFPRGARFAALSSFSRPGSYDQADLYLRGPLQDQLTAFIEHGRSSGSLYAVLDADQQQLMPPLATASVDRCMPFVAHGRNLQLCAVELPAPSS